MEILYHGHSCIQMTSEQHSIIFDPFISGNPNAKTKVDDIKVDYILLTHGHEDHILDAAQIAKQNDATIIAIPELAAYMEWKGLKTSPMNMGGTIDLGFAKVKMIQAFHSSSNIFNDEKKIVYLGMPGGFILDMSGKTILHPGDTSLFGDMKIIGELHSIDLAFLPIGDRFTMGPNDAVLAAEWLKANKVVPIHYNTFPFIMQDEHAFSKKLSEKGIETIIMGIGESITF